MKIHDTVQGALRKKKLITSGCAHGMLSSISRVQRRLGKCARAAQIVGRFSAAVLCAVLLLDARAAQTSGTANVDVDAREFGLVEKDDAAIPLRRALAKCKERGATRLIIPPGTYRIGSAYAEEITGSPSNADRGIMRVALLVEGFERLEIVGVGAEFLFRDQMVPIAIRNSKAIAVRGITLDWEKMLAFDAKVIATNATENSFDLQVHPDCAADILDGVLVHGPNPTEAAHRLIYRQDVSCNRFYDPLNQVWLLESPYDGDHAFQAWNPAKKVFATYESLGGNRFRLFNATRKLPQVGWQVMAKGTRTPNRRSPAIWISGSESVVLDDVKIYHAGGMGVIAERSRDIRLSKLQVVPRPGSGRTVSTSADATHFAACAGTIELLDCRFEQMFDDGFNVHGIYFLVDRIEGPRSVIVRAGHFQQVGQQFAQRGDRISFSTRKDLEEIQTVTVDKTESLNGDRMVLTLAQDLAPGVVPGLLGENLSWSPNLVVRNCTIKSNVSRSFLLSTSGRIIIEDSEFFRPSAMIGGSGAEAEFWFESGALRDVTFRRNRVEVGTEGQPAFAMTAPIPGFHSNLTIEDNDFVLRGGAIMRLSGFNNVKFNNNRIKEANGKTSALGFALKDCSSVEISDNSVLNGPVYFVETTGSTSGVKVDRNRGIVSHR